MVQHVVAVGCLELPHSVIGSIKAPGEVVVLEAWIAMLVSQRAVSLQAAVCRPMGVLVTSTFTAHPYLSVLLSSTALVRRGTHPSSHRSATAEDGPARVRHALSVVGGLVVRLW